MSVTFQTGCVWPTLQVLTQGVSVVWRHCLAALCCVQLYSFANRNCNTSDRVVECLMQRVPGTCSRGGQLHQLQRLVLKTQGQHWQGPC